MLQCSQCSRRFITEPDSEPGEIRICIDCKHMMVFTDDLSLRELTDPEKAEMARDPRLLWSNVPPDSFKLLLAVLIVVFIIASLNRIGVL